MTSKIINRYIWLINQMLMRKEMTFEEIAKNWETSNLNDGKPLAKRTFHDHRKAIKELFGVEIKCNTSTNKYYLSSEDSLKNSSIQKWLLSSFTVSNMIEAGHNMKDRIFFEAIPKGTEFISTVIESMQQNKVLLIDYQPFDQHNKSIHFCPYAMKIYNQRWYMVGLIQEQENVRTIAFDRIREMDSQKKDSLFQRHSVPRSCLLTESVSSWMTKQHHIRSSCEHMAHQWITSAHFPCTLPRKKSEPSTKSIVTFSIKSISLQNWRPRFWLWERTSRSWNRKSFVTR